MTKQIRGNDPARFESYVERVPFSTCWYWMGALNRKGYGQFRVDGTLRITHRYSYEQFVGEIPKGALILHDCDTPCCVNPDHLRPGSQQDNMDDMKRRGRSPVQPGESNPFCKVSDATVRLIRDSTLQQRTIAKMYGISQAQVGRIKRGESRN